MARLWPVAPVTWPKTAFSSALGFNGPAAPGSADCAKPIDGRDKSALLNPYRFMSAPDGFSPGLRAPTTDVHLLLSPPPLVSPRPRCDTPPDGFRVVITPPEPELNLPAAAALLRILTRHATRAHPHTPATGTSPAGALTCPELSVDGHPDHQPKDT
ncbi:hypothetical protein GCM10010341_50040 [Streptomyces noursei]|nr:hypothetical protein GCM10010341_50040 [Streptomyces noursei]